MFKISIYVLICILILMQVIAFNIKPLNEYLWKKLLVNLNWIACLTCESGRHDYVKNYHSVLTVYKMLVTSLLILIYARDPISQIISMDFRVGYADIFIPSWALEEHWHKALFLFLTVWIYSYCTYYYYYYYYYY